MIYAKHQLIADKFYEYLVKYWLYRDFSTFHIYYNEPIPQHPILLIGNHHSWWDGFWCLAINYTLWKKKFHVMMLEQELKKHPSFHFAGAYSIGSNPVAILQSLNYTCQLLKNNNNLVVLFPQGKFMSHYHFPFNFQKGIEYISKHEPNISLMFYASFVDFGKNKQLNVDCYVESSPYQSAKIQDIEHYYNAFYLRSKISHEKIYNE